jgi:hypothetical protein
MMNAVQKALLAIVLMSPFASLAEHDSGAELFKCNVTVGDHYLRRRNPILLEIKEREVRFEKKSAATDLQMIAHTDELSEAVRGPLQVMGTLFRDQGVLKLRLGVYQMLPRNRRITGEFHWIPDESDEQSYYYADPITETNWNFKANEEFSLDLRGGMGAFSLGYYEAANQLKLKCQHIRSL